MRILFVTSTRIGDAVLSTGLLSHLVRDHPHARLTIACGPVAAPLFGAVPGLERIIVLEKQPWARHWRNLWRECIGLRWDIIVDLRGSLATLFLRSPRRYVYHTDRALAHKVRQLARVMDLHPPPAPTLWTLPVHEAEARALIPDGAPVLALGPTVNWAGKQWPIENFIALTERLTAEGRALAGARVLVLGAPGERDVAAPLIEAIPPERLIDAVGTLHLLTAFACMKRARLYVGNDSGLMHMAAASGAATLGLFGPSRDEHYGPWGRKCAVARTPESYETLMPRGLDTAACGCLMGGLGVDAVESAAEGLISRTRAAA